jgi:hypothetical protein
MIFRESCNNNNNNNNNHNNNNNNNNNKDHARMLRDKIAQLDSIYSYHRKIHCAHDVLMLELCELLPRGGAPEPGGEVPGRRGRERAGHGVEPCRPKATKHGRFIRKHSSRTTGAITHQTAPLCPMNEPIQSPVSPLRI